MFSGIAWLAFGLAIVQAGRWLERGDGIGLAFGKLLQVLGIVAVALMLATFPSTYFSYQSDSSAVLYAGLVVVIGGFIFLAGMGLVLTGTLLKRGASKKAVIPAALATGVLVMVCLRIIN
ncbi:hypothetical protein [Paramagnetospirillum magnetotacticum]|uniref:hypothetical protein n=1 Tax=Paramagnetospirillum magnetotacticum TaxID=188 RepID=UPI000596EBA7|nr:hypothetical protein [Paramagnetospirillum magnetotacticum]